MIGEADYKLSPALQDANGASEEGVGKPKETQKKKQNSKQSQAAAAEAEEQRKAQLELILMDDRALQNAVRLGEMPIDPCTKSHSRT